MRSYGSSPSWRHKLARPRRPNESPYRPAGTRARPRRRPSVDRARPRVRRDLSGVDATGLDRPGPTPEFRRALPRARVVDARRVRTPPAAWWRPSRSAPRTRTRLETAHVGLVFVHPSRWREGIAGTMLERAEADMVVRGYVREQLWTPRGAPAERFYEERGGARTAGPTGTRGSPSRWPATRETSCEGAARRVWRPRARLPDARPRLRVARPRPRRGDRDLEALARARRGGGHDLLRRAGVSGFPTREQPLKPYQAAVRAAQTTREFVRSFAPDVAVSDILTTAPALACELEDVPVATLIPHLYPDLPPGWPPFSIGARLPRTRLGTALWRPTAPARGRGLEQGRTEYNDARARLGLDPLPYVHTGLSRSLTLIGTFPHLEYPRGWAPWQRIVGPMLWEPAAPASPRRTARARRPRRDLDLPGPVPLAVERLPGRPRRRTRARDRDLSRRPPRPGQRRPRPVDVLRGDDARLRPRDHPRRQRHRPRALACGVPVLICPAGGDMAENAARVDWAGVGVRLAPRFGTPSGRPPRRPQALSNPSLRTRARELRPLVGRTPGPTTAAAEVGPGRPPSPRLGAVGASRPAPRASRLAPRASRLAPRASRLAPRASRLAPRASRLAPRASRLAPRASRLVPRPSARVRDPARSRVAEARSYGFSGGVSRTCTVPVRPGWPPWPGSV